jgi:hypothetical protein
MVALSLNFVANTLICNRNITKKGMRSLHGSVDDLAYCATAASGYV